MPDVHVIDEWVGTPRIIDCSTLEKALHLYDTDRGRFRVRKPGSTTPIFVSEMLPEEDKRDSVVREQIRAYYDK